MRFLRFVWKLFIMASVFGVGYIVGREHSFEEEEMWEEEAEKLEEEDDESDDESDKEPAEVEFELEDPEATKVSLVGTFNDWNKNSNPMKKEDGIWKCSVNLKPGTYQYQFVINDTDWVVDPKSENNVQNKYEGKNSVIEVK